MTCYIPSTYKERISDTIQVIPHLIPIPNSIIESTLKETADKLVRYLNVKPNLLDAEPNDTTEALAQIAKLLNRTELEPPPLATPSIPEAIPVTSGGVKQKSTAPKSSEHAIVDQTAISKDSGT